MLYLPLADRFSVYLTIVKECIMKNFIRFMKNEEGATAIEYGLIAALIAVVIIVALTSLGGNLNVVFTNVSDNLAR